MVLIWQESLEELKMLSLEETKIAGGSLLEPGSPHLGAHGGQVTGMMGFHSGTRSHSDSGRLGQVV